MLIVNLPKASSFLFSYIPDGYTARCVKMISLSLFNYFAAAAATSTVVVVLFNLNK